MLILFPLSIDWQVGIKCSRNTLEYAVDSVGKGQLLPSVTSCCFVFCENYSSYLLIGFACADPTLAGKRNEITPHFILKDIPKGLRGSSWAFVCFSIAFPLIYLFAVRAHSGHYKVDKRVRCY